MKELKLISEGGQYGVYDLGNGRVLKKFTGISSKASKFKSWYPDSSKFQQYKYFYNSLKLCLKAKKHVIKYSSNGLLIKTLAYPEYVGLLNYTQDKVVVLYEIISKSDLFIFEKLVEKYVENIFNCWRFGFTDVVWNFKVNNGIDADGDVVLLDFGEIIFDKNIFKNYIKNEHWTKAGSYLSLPDAHKKIYKDIMKSRITLENLEKYRDEFTS